jgi:OOP family OmpA-OmpF porin
MKKQIITFILSGMVLYAGGKTAAPATTPIVPIVKEANVIPFYIGLGAMASFVERDPCLCNPDGENLEDNQYGWVARVGYDFNQFIGVEARALKTVGSDNFSDVTHYGLFLKPQYPITKQSNLYALLGYGKTDVDYTNGSLKCTDSEDGFSYGLGFEYDFTEEKAESKHYSRTFDGQGDEERGWGLWVDFQHLLNNAGDYNTDSDIVTAGITYDF